MTPEPFTRNELTAFGEAVAECVNRNRSRYDAHQLAGAAHLISRITEHLKSLPSAGEIVEAVNQITKGPTR